MRNLLLIGVAVLVLGAVGCGTEEEHRRDRIAYEDWMWNGREHMPDKILGMGEYAPQDPVASKKPAAPSTPAPTVMQASATGNP